VTINFSRTALMQRLCYTQQKTHEPHFRHKLTTT